MKSFSHRCFSHKLWPTVCWQFQMLSLEKSAFVFQWVSSVSEETLHIDITASIYILKSNNINILISSWYFTCCYCQCILHSIYRNESIPYNKNQIYSLGAMVWHSSYCILCLDLQWRFWCTFNPLKLMNCLPQNLHSNSPECAFMCVAKAFAS